ncbi:ABC transporter ATP-binding protein [Paenibacillaceae bacterium]|nr:ABC transporter ATP-binding protein [Paenibacillaceae bacterium]
MQQQVSLSVNVKKFWRLVVKHRPAAWKVTAAVLLGLSETVLSLIIPLFTMGLVDELASSSLRTTTIVSLAVVFLAQTATSGLSIYTMSYVGQHIIAGIRNELWRRVLRLPVPFFDRNKSGETMSRITNDTNVVKEFITGQIIPFVSGVVSIVGAVILLLTIDWKITLFLLLSVPLATLILWPLGSRMFSVSRATQEETAQFQGDLGRVLSDIRLVKASMAEEREYGQGVSRVAKLFRYGLREAKIMSIVSPLMMSIILLLLVLLIGYGGLRVADGTLSGGALVGILLYMFQIVVPFTQMASFFTQFQKAMGASERIVEILAEATEEHESVLDEQERQRRAPNTMTEHEGSASNNESQRSSGEINGQALSFHEVSFAYSADHPVLHHISFTAPAGRMTAIVGPSGTGKTTLFSLIERFYEPTGGRVEYDRQPIANMPFRQWRERIAYVSQESPMMSGSIRDNITYGLEGVDDQTIDQAIEQANLTAFIAGLPEGYHTEIGERGVKLSGGQRQRLAIARAIVRKPAVLLLDEATAHLDSESERSVQEAMNTLMKERTTLVIAHRLSTIRNADQIIVIEDGQLSGQGTHEELLASHSLYSRLVQQQYH